MQPCNLDKCYSGTLVQPIPFSAMQMEDEMTHQHHSLYFIKCLYLADSFIQNDLDCTLYQ